MGDKSSPHIDDIDGSGQRQQRSSIRPVAAGRVVPPKPPRKTGSKDKPLEGSAAISSSQDVNCIDRLNCKPSIETDGKMVVGNRRDSTMDNSSENEGLVEWVPAVQSIILALEQETAANDPNRSAFTDSVCSIDLNKSDRFSRCRFNFDVKKDNTLLNSDVRRDSFLQPAVGKSQPPFSAKKTPPQVPEKTFKYDQGRILQVNSSPLQPCNKITHMLLTKIPRHQLCDIKRFPNDADILLSEAEKLQIYHSKYSPFRIGENGLECVSFMDSSEAYLEAPVGLDSDSLKNCGRRLWSGSGSVALDSPAWTTSSSACSLVKEQQRDGFDAEELEMKLKSITSFTTEDMEFCQRPECQPSQSYQCLNACEEATRNVKRMKDPTKQTGSCLKERARNRRSRSVGAPGFHLKDFVQHKERPKVPAKPKNRIKGEIVGKQWDSEISSSSSISISGVEKIHGIPAERAREVICGTFEQAFVLQVNDDLSLNRERRESPDSRWIISCEQTGVTRNNAAVVSEVQIEPDLHLKPDPQGKVGDSKVSNSAAMHFPENFIYSGGKNAPKLHFTDFSCEFEVPNVPQSNLIYVSHDLRLRDAPETQFAQVPGDLKVENTSVSSLDAITSTSGISSAADSNLIDVPRDSYVQPILGPPIQNLASDSRFPCAAKACHRESLYDEDYSSARSFEVNSRSESLASNLVDLDQEMLLESSESLASASAIKLDELDSSSESCIFRGSVNGSIDSVGQEKFFGDPQQKHMSSCDETSSSHSTRNRSADTEISNTASLPQFDLTFSTVDAIVGSQKQGDRSSLYAEILQTLAKSSPSQNSESTMSESPYSQGRAALISSEASNPRSQKSYDAGFDARKLSAAIDGMRLEMDSICAVEQKKQNSKQLSFTTHADSGPKKGSTTILRNMSGRLPADRKKSMNRKASRAESFKAWQRVTCRSARKSSSKRRDSNLDDLNMEDLSFSDNDDFDFEMDSFSDESDSDIDISSPSITNEKTERTKQLNARTAFHIASELLTTESNYVRKLHLVDQVFHLEVVVQNRQHHMFGGEVIPQMFSNIKSIYQFHHDFVLPQLEKRMLEWDTNPRIGDVMKKFAPFLKLYTEYVRNFDSAITTINLWMERSPKFQKLIETIQKLPECGQLNLQHHMLEPVQRVPRYQLLLKDYLRHLPEDSADREDTIEALELVTQAARHSNEVMRKIEKFRKLVDINESLGGTIDLVSSSREFVKEGKLTRISARDGSHMDRYLLLFSDLFLVCQSLPLNIGQKQQYRIKSRMDFDGMEIVTDGHNLETANTFYVKGKQKSIELHASSADEKNEWMTAFRNVIAGIQTNNQRDVLTDEQLGKRAPTWIKDQETSMCMSCCSPFNAFRRRHHCRACGHVVCGKCSSRRAQLAYIENREKRVCDACFQTLYGVQQRKCSTESADTVSSSDEPVRKKAPGILQVKASDPAVIQGYLNMCCKRKTWSRRFFAVHADFVLYCFKAHQDVVALTSLPLPGYRVECDATDDKLFKVFHMGQKKIFYFQAEDENTRTRWTDALQQLVQLQLPSNSLNEPRTPV